MRFDLLRHLLRPALALSCSFRLRRRFVLTTKEDQQWTQMAMRQSSRGALPD